MQSNKYRTDNDAIMMEEYIPVIIVAVIYAALLFVYDRAKSKKSE